MRVFSIAKGFHQLWKLQAANLGQKELTRLRAIRIFRGTADVKLTCATFGISRATLYRWVGQFDSKDLSSLREQSRRPKRLRKPKWSFELLKEVRQLRQQYPRWGKDKLVVLLRDRGWKTSTSTVGRIIHYLKRRGDIVEPKTRPISSKRRQKRTYAIRKPADYLPRNPGDLVQIDTLDIRPLPWVILKQFTARDVISKWDVIEAWSNATATSAKEFIDTLQRRMPFPVRAVQVDGGSEFYADFERTCEKRAIRLFVLPPKSPKLNGSVERANRTHTEEFYEVNECSWLIPELNEQLRQWEHVYNCIRPHQTLQYKTPLQFLKDSGIMHDYKPLQ
jgi:transposase InsO family protein